MSLPPSSDVANPCTEAQLGAHEELSNSPRGAAGLFPREWATSFVASLRPVTDPIRAAGMGEASREGKWPGVESDEPSSVFLATSRRLRGRASWPLAGPARVVDDDDADGAIVGIIVTVIA